MQYLTDNKIVVRTMNYCFPEFPYLTAPHLHFGNTPTTRTRVPVFSPQQCLWDAASIRFNNYLENPTIYLVCKAIQDMKPY